MATGNTVAHAVRCALHERSTWTRAAQLGGILLLASTSFGAPTAFADPADDAQSDAASNATLQEVVVVGSRIRRDVFNAPAPIQVIDREETTLAGFSSTTDVLQSTAVTAGSGQINNSFGGFVTNGGPGANTLSLRGLGPERTLVLVNGRRIAPSGVRGALGSADLNVLPTAIVERIEILKDGASTVYGSDAVAGVVNITTRKDFNGLEFEAFYSNPDIDAGRESTFSVVGGLAGERWRVAGSLEYRDQQKVQEGDRAFSRCPRDLFRDPVTGESLDTVDARTGEFKCRTITGRGSQGVTINTIGTRNISAANAAALGLTGSPVGAPGATVTIFNRFRPNSGVSSGLRGFEGVGGSQANGTPEDPNLRDTFDPAMLDQTLLSPVRNTNLFVEAAYDLQALGDAEVFFELLANERKSAQTAYRQLTLDYQDNNPLIPADLAFTTTAANRFSGPQLTSNGRNVAVRGFIGFGNLVSSQEVQIVRPALGIRGDLFIEGWRYEAAVQYSKSEGDFIQNAFLTDKLTFASDVVAAPAGLDASLVRNGFTCRVNLTNPGERCVPFPALNADTIGGRLSQDFRDYIVAETKGVTEFEERIATGTIDGPLFNLPYGEVKAVFGLEYRRQKIDDTPDPNSVANNLFNLTSSAVTRGTDTVREAFTEVDIPILEGLPGANALNISGSYRYTDYNSFGSDKTERYGLVYSPIREVSLRYNRGSSFRAPALFEQFQGATTGFQPAQTDPCNNYGNNANANIRANCAMELPGNPSFNQNSGITVFNVGGAANGLTAETSDNITYGIVVQPDLGSFGKLSVAVDYFDIEVENGVDQLGAVNILPLCYSDPDFRAGGEFCRLTTRDPITNQLRVSDAFTNIATEAVRGIDYNLRYEVPVGPGRLLVNSQFTQFKSQKLQLFPGDEVLERNGSVTRPKVTGDLALTYSIKDWAFRYGVEFVEKTDSTKLFEEDPETTILDLTTANYYLHSASVRYESGNWSTTLGVRNLYDESPPTVSAASLLNRRGTAPLYSGYDFEGRQVFLRATMNFGPKN